MKNRLLPKLVLSLALYACNGIAEQNNLAPEMETKTITPVANSKAGILNNIIVQESGGLHVLRAYLALEDGRLLPKTNTVSLEETVYLMLIIDKTSLANNKVVLLNAAQKIVTDKGELVLNAADLLNDTSVINTNKPANLQLQTTITKTRKDIAYFIVDYRVWNKGGNEEVKGSYKLYVEE